MKKSLSYDKNIFAFNNIPFFGETDIVVFYTHFMKEKKNKWELKEHSHSFCELHIILNGDCVMNISDCETVLKKYDYLLIPNGVKHCFKSCSEDFFRFSVAFDIAFNQSQTVCLKNAKKCKLEKSKIYYVKNILREYRENKIGSQNIINFNISSLLIEILRSSDVLSSDCVDESVVHPVLRKAALYIENNISERITADEVAREIFLSVRHLNRIFVNDFGMTVAQYIKSKKITSAKEYLEKTNFTIKEIASLVGMESDSAFCKIFKKATGISPKMYRLRNRKTVM